MMDILISILQGQASINWESMGALQSRHQPSVTEVSHLPFDFHEAFGPSSLNLQPSLYHLSPMEKELSDLYPLNLLL